MTKRKLAFILSAISAIALLGREAGAEERADVRQLAEKYQESKKDLVDAESEKRRILGSLYSITKRMKKITQEKGHLTDELFHVQDNVQNIARVIANLEEQIAEQRKRLRARLRTLYKLSGEGYLGILFSQSNSQELDQTLKFLKIVTDADYRLIRNYQRNVAVYKDQRKRLKVQVERLVRIERKIRTQEHLLVREHKAKTQIVSELDKSQKAALTQIKKIRTTTQAIQAKEADDTIQSLFKASFFEQKGQIPPPVVGQIVQDFGLIKDERYKIQISHKGWQYGSPAGTPVISVFDGVVAYSGWLDGYGNALIIDHGDHYYTVYGHLAKPRLKVGDEAKRGQTIAETGSTSRKHGDGIYFEIRHFSEPENPKNWLSQKGVPVSTKTEEKSTDPVELATAQRLGTQ